MSRVINIRPHQILSMGNDFCREYKAFIPEPYNGGMSAFENIVIIKLLNLINPKRIFEFGTYRGNTTRFILENLDLKSNKDRKIYTLDLPSLDDVYFENGDDKLALTSINSHKSYLKSKLKEHVIQIFCDSMKFNIEETNERFDFILIDGNHAYEYVKKDTENALKSINDKNSVIIWDDYNAIEYKGVADYINELSQHGLRIFHVVGTNFAIYLTDDIDIPAQKHGVILPQ